MLFNLIIDLKTLIPAIFIHIFNPTTQLAITKGMAIKKAKAEMKAHPRNVENKMSLCSV